jgi:hypothetical protein
MFKKYLLGFVTFIVAFAILSVSFLQSASVSYVFATPPPEVTLGSEAPDIDYVIPYPGRISPDNPLWSLKAIRDRVWYTVTISPLKRAELALLFSDKRLAASKSLFEEKKPDIAVSTLSKGEKYLEIAVKEEAIARSKGFDTSDFLTKLATASLKHRQVIEELMPLVPEDGRPTVVQSEDYAKNAYKSSRDALSSRGLESPKNPFDGE